MLLWWGAVLLAVLEETKASQVWQLLRARYKYQHNTWQTNMYNLSTDPCSHQGPARICA